MLYVGVPCRASDIPQCTSDGLLLSIATGVPVPFVRLFPFERFEAIARQILPLPVNSRQLDTVRAVVLLT